MPHNTSVYQRFLRVLLPICIGAFVVVIAAFEWGNYQQARQTLLDKLQTIGSVYSLLVAEPVALGNTADMDLYSVSLISDPDIAYIQILGQNHDVLEQYGQGEQVEAEFYKRLKINYATETGIRTIGSLALGVTDHRIVEEMRRRIKYEVILLLVLISAVLLGTWFAYRHAVGKPVSRLFAAIKHYEAYGVHRPVKKVSDDELGALISAYNAMREQQLIQQDEVLEYQKTLEFRVIERTRDLEAELDRHAQTAEKLSYQASHDVLTGVFNRRDFERRISALSAGMKAGDAHHALFFMDLDRFKTVNDTSGHAAGDELLKRIAALLQKHLRKGDVLARVGGDEFAVLLMACDLVDARQVAEKMRRSVEDYCFACDGQVFTLGLSIGVVPIEAGSGTADIWLAKADAACYLAKKAGRNQVRIHEEDDKELVAHQSDIRWATELRNAFDEDRFELWFQPIQMLDDAGAGPARFRWCEILLRLRTRDDEPHTPAEFMSAVERHGFAMRVDLWVIERCLSCLQDGVPGQQGIEKMFVNLSGQSLGDAVFLERVRDAFDRYGVSGERVVFEVTETTMISNLAAAQRFMQELSARGCLFALDDFGSGLSSFGYLRNLAVDFIKIEGSFVRDMVEDSIDREMVKAINAMAHAMGQKVIAEFVESEAIFNELREIGVDYVQGDWLGKAAPVEFSDAGASGVCKLS